MTRRLAAATAFELGVDMWMLRLESTTVIGLRTLKLAAGGATIERESRRMVEEKLAAVADLPAVLATLRAITPEGLTSSALHHFSKKVRANRKRLSGRSARP